jgi:glycosyltransferase 2 family protein
MNAPRGGARAPRRRNALLSWKSILGLAIGAIALYFTFRNMDFALLGRELLAADPFLLALAAAAVTGVFWIRAWRWKVILEPVAVVPFRSRFAATTIGFMGNNLLPARVGEFMRAYALSRTERVPVVASFASLVVERLFDGVLVIVLLFISMSLPGFPEFSGAQEFRLFEGTDFQQVLTIGGLARGVTVIVGAVIFVLGGLVLMPRIAVRVLERIVQVLPPSVRRPIVDALEAFLTGVAVLRDPRLLLRATAWSVALWVFNAFGAWLGFRAFGLDLPFSGALFFQSVIALAVSLPSPPGYVGIYHAVATFIVSSLFGAATPEHAVAFATGFHAAGFIPVTLIGLYYAWKMGLSMTEATMSEESVEQAVERRIADNPDAVDRAGGDRREQS